MSSLVLCVGPRPGDEVGSCQREDPAAPGRMPGTRYESIVRTGRPERKGDFQSRPRRSSLLKLGQKHGLPEEGLLGLSSELWACAVFLKNPADFSSAAQVRRAWKRFPTSCFPTSSWPRGSCQDGRS